MHDPFSVFDLEPQIELDEDQLERRFLELSRDTHPALVHAVDSPENVDRLMRSAEVNDAWRILKDRWSRARAALESREPGVIGRTSKLPPDLLMEVMEQQEAAAMAAPEAQPKLLQRAEAALKSSWEALLDHFRHGDFTAAAVQVHLAQYHSRTIERLTKA